MDYSNFSGTIFSRDQPYGNISMEPGEEESGMFQFNLALTQYVMPTIYSVGITSNVFTICLILNTKLAEHASMVYVAGIVIADTGCLVCAVLTWLQFFFQLNIYHRVGMCQLINYCIKAFTFLRRWYMAGFSVERFIWELHPERRSEICNGFKTKIILVSLSVVAAYGHVYLCWFSEVSEDTHFMCMVHRENLDTFNVMIKIDMVVAFLAPTAVVICLGVPVSLSKVKCKRRHCGDTNGGDDDTYRRHRSQIVDNRDGKVKRLHATLIFLCLVLSLLILSLPLDASTFIGVMFSKFPLPRSWFTVLEVMSYIQVSVKPFICILISSEIRGQLRRVFCSCFHTSEDLAVSCPNSNSIIMEESTSIALISSGSQGENMTASACEITAHDG